MGGVGKRDSIGVSVLGSDIERMANGFLLS
jgi:hypothetical protein